MVQSSLTAGRFGGRRFRLLVLALALQFLLGCGDDELLQGLSQSQAIEVVAVLGDHGIESRYQSQTGAGAKFSVQVPPEDYQEAVKLLSSSELPSKPKKDFDDLIGSGSFLPQSRSIETLRIDRALSLQVEEQLSSFPGVQSVKAVVRSPSGDYKRSSSRGVAVVVVRDPQVDKFSSEGLFDLLKVVFPDVEQTRIKIEVVAGIRQSQAILPKIEIDGIQGSRRSRRVEAERDYVDFLWLTKIKRSDYLVGSTIFLGIMGLAGFVGAFFGYILYVRYAGSRNQTGGSLISIGKSEEDSSLLSETVEDSESPSHLG